jgi:predicted dithiol-disulfide oxidoreductase (DUF899 family)
VSTLFGDKDTLLIYSMMYGPQRGAVSHVHVVPELVERDRDQSA